MPPVSIQDRTGEFRAILTDVNKRQLNAKSRLQRQTFSSAPQDSSVNGTLRQRSAFAQQAAGIGKGISNTMAKLERLAQLAKKKTLFDDRPVEVEELTFVIKQDLSALTQSLAQLRELSRKEHPKAWVKGPHAPVDQEGEHGKNVVVMLSGHLEGMTDSLKGVLRTRMDNMLSSKARTERFVSNVSQYSQNLLDPSRSDSPLYNNSAQRTAAQQDTLSLEPASSETQLLLMEEAQTHNPYIQQRGEAIEMIERTMNELGGMFSQLAQMVHEQGEQISRIDDNVEAVTDNVEGAQRELLRYWNRMSGNRTLIAKMFGVLMIFFLVWVLVAG
ncbi:t-SNARE [Phialemonium atrogriseum]|uniref:t-SNARE n=1 Tax=Phialemonium atrogriseum TaxID=1093897 RepID=A0AAJ0C610_9PEZI|nr:t-SNARE [Phialemonium atrogriseum]KAK1769372.1 t-SNARE [Phialemonium atrogriseum]